MEEKSIPAGWYADPLGNPQLRYWNGEVWTEQTSPLPPPSKPFEKVNNSLPKLTSPEDYDPDTDLTENKNTIGRLGFLIGILSLLVNPYLIVGAVAIVASIAGIDRAIKWEKLGYPAFGRTPAKIGIVLGILSTLFGIYSLAV